MTPDDFRRIRKRVAPHLSQAAFAKALGYMERDAYRRYESGARQAPPLLVRVMWLLDERGTLPDDFARLHAPPAETGER